MTAFPRPYFRMGDGLGEGCPPTIVSLIQGSGRLTKAVAHALLLREIVVFIAPAPSIDKVITGVLLSIKVPAWEGCAARPGECLGSAVFWERESRGAQMSRAQKKGGEARVSLGSHTAASQGRTLCYRNVSYRCGQSGPSDTLLHISFSL